MKYYEYLLSESLIGLVSLREEKKRAEGLRDHKAAKKKHVVPLEYKSSGEIISDIDKKIPAPLKKIHPILNKMVGYTVGTDHGYSVPLWKGMGGGTVTDLLATVTEMGLDPARIGVRQVRGLWDLHSGNYGKESY